VDFTRERSLVRNQLRPWDSRLWNAVFRIGRSSSPAAPVDEDDLLARPSDQAGLAVNGKEPLHARGFLVNPVSDAL
jgi:hypothetical protein